METQNEKNESLLLELLWYKQENERLNKELQRYIDSEVTVGKILQTIGCEWNFDLLKIRKEILYYVFKQRWINNKSNYE